MALITLTNGKSFICENGVSLLDAARQADIGMPYSCRTGRCSSCRCKVLSGDSSALREELGLSDREQSEGYILACVRTAVTDLSLQVDDLAGFELPPIKMLPCRIHDLRKLASDVVKVVLRLPPNSDFHFLPGQYIDVIGEGGIRRSYSLANADAGEKHLELHIRAVPEGAMSAYWFERAKVNDLLRLNGPLGTFFLRNIAGLDLVFLATGTGFAPVKAMLENIETLPVGDRPNSISVFWGGRVPQDFYWDISGIGLHLNFIPVLSRANPNWSGARGYVQDILFGSRPDLSKTVVYACGSDAMIHGAKRLWLDAGLSEQSFLSDAFVCSG